MEEKLKKNGPTQEEARKILAKAAIKAISDNDDIKYVRFYYEDWPDQKQQNFTKMQVQIIERLKKWGKLEA